MRGRAKGMGDKKGGRGLGEKRKEKEKRTDRTGAEEILHTWMKL